MRSLMGLFITFSIFTSTASYAQDDIGKDLDELRSLTKEVTQRLISLSAEYSALRKQFEALSSAPQAVREPPVGTIFASLLTEEQFQQLFGLGWVLADGRTTAGTRFREISGKEQIPDLRGMFLRGLNGGRRDGLEDPDGGGRVPGSMQKDELFRHRHGLEWRTPGLASGQTKPNNFPVLPNEYFPTANQGAGQAVAAAGAAESRPKNVAVFWYLRVN